MYLANKETPTPEIRINYGSGIDSEWRIEQKWIVRENYVSRYQWRKVPCVRTNVMDDGPVDDSTICD